MANIAHNDNTLAEMCCSGETLVSLCFLSQVRPSKLSVPLRASSRPHWADRVKAAEPEVNRALHTKLCSGVNVRVFMMVP